MTKESNVDVLVVGAGPAGLFATNALVKAGINVKVIDQRLEKFHPSAGA
jgi:phenol 2-monooxygenase